MTAQIIPFVPRDSVTRKPMTDQTPEQQAIGLSLEVEPEQLLTFYESSTGFVAPEEDGA